MAKLGLSALIRFLDRVGLSLKSGVDVRRTLQQETQRASPSHRWQFQQLEEKVAAGDSLADAMNSLGDFFPPLTRELIHVGEKTGRMDDIFHGLHQHYRHVQSLRRTFIGGIIWPAIQMTAAVVIVGLLIAVFSFMLSPTNMMGEPIDILGLGVTGPSAFYLYCLLVVVFFGSLTGAVLGLTKGWFGPKPMEWMMHAPVLGGQIRTLALSRLVWTLSLALESGLDARRAVRMALRSTQNPYYMAHLESVDQMIVQGREFHESLRATGAFPEDFLNALEVAEQTGSAGESLGRLAEDYRQRAQSAFKIMAVVASFAVWAIVAVLLVILIFRLAMVLYIGPMYDALEAI